MKRKLMKSLVLTVLFSMLSQGVVARGSTKSNTLKKPTSSRMTSSSSRSSFQNSSSRSRSAPSMNRSSSSRSNSVRDHRTPTKAPVVRDHRTPTKAAVIRDHRKPTNSISAPKPRVPLPRPLPRPGTGVSTPKPRPPIGTGAPKPRPRPFPLPPQTNPLDPGIGNGQPAGGHNNHTQQHNNHQHNHWHNNRPKQCWWWFNYCKPLQHCRPTDYHFVDYRITTCNFRNSRGVIIEDARWYLGIKGMLLPGKGLGIESVDANSPAALAGILPGMVITKSNGIVIIDDASFAESIAISGGLLDLELLGTDETMLLEGTVQMTRIVSVKW